MPEARARRKAGFTLTEVIVTMVLISALAAVIIPTVFARAKVARADAIIAELSNFESGIMLYRNDVGRYPYRLDYLYRYPTTFPAVEHPFIMDGCATQLSTTNKNKYRGPYINKPLPLFNEGTDPRFLLPTGDSLQSTLVIQPNFGGQRVINMTVTGPELDIAQIIDTKVDGVVNAIAGKIQYQPYGGGTGPDADMDQSLTWTIPVRTGNC